MLRRRHQSLPFSTELALPEDEGTGAQVAQVAVALGRVPVDDRVLDQEDSDEDPDQDVGQPGGRHQDASGGGDRAAGHSLAFGQVHRRQGRRFRPVVQRPGDGADLLDRQGARWGWQHRLRVSGGRVSPDHPDADGGVRCGGQADAERAKGDEQDVAALRALEMKSASPQRSAAPIRRRRSAVCAAGSAWGWKNPTRAERAPVHPTAASS